MNTNESENAPKDIASAEAELQSAQETFEAAKARLEELKKTPATTTPEWVPYSTSGVTPDASGSVGNDWQPPEAFQPQPQQQQAQPQPPQQQPPCGTYAPPSYAPQTPPPGSGAVPPQQPYYGNPQQYYQQPYSQNVVVSKDHVAAGLLGIFLGGLGIHKFYLGYNTAGFIMLAVSIIGSIFTFGLAGGAMWIISIIEGILYLTKSQSEFEQTYVVNKRDWF